MKYRPLGNTGIEVSEIGFGAWGIGGQSPGATSYGATNDSVSLSALGAALDHGITYYDTANVYGDGHSEELIGTAFRRCRDKVVIGTKAGLLGFHSPPEFAPRSLRESLIKSLRRLKTDYVDLLQLHNPAPDMLFDRPEIIRCLEDLQREGLVRAFGLSLKAPEQGQDVIAHLGSAVLQINLNMLDLRAIDSGLLITAASEGVGIIARTPLNFGFLSGTVDETTSFVAGDHRANWPKSQIERWSTAARSIRDQLPSHTSQEPSIVAVRFCLSFPEVATVIPGMMTPHEVASNVKASKYGVLDDEEIKSVFDIYHAQPGGVLED